MNHAPIVLFAFNRIAPLKQCVTSLLANPEAASTDLIAYVDGARADREGEADRVNEVCSFLKGISGFRSTEIHQSSVNKGLGPSIIEGVTDVINRYGRVIVIEDDLCLAGNFLSYMNQGLERYEGVRSVFSVCGYSNRVKVPKSYSYDTYFGPRSSSWGWATWKDRWDSCDFKLDNWAEVEKTACRFNAWGGSDCFGMLKAWKQGRNQSWAIRFCYNQFVQYKLSLFPVKSLVENNGFDGDGTNCRKWSRFRSETDRSGKTQFSFPDKVAVNCSLRRQCLSYHSLAARVYSRLMYLIYR